MPNLIIDLFVDRVDLVEEGANSAAFIELYKRKEPIKMELDQILAELKPEHAEVIKSKLGEVTTLETELAKAKEDNEKLTSDLEQTNEVLKETEGKIPCDCPGEADENGNCKTCGRKKLQKSGSSFDETETLTKSLPKEVQEYLEVVKSQKIAAEEALRKANEEKIQSEAIAKAANLKSLPVEQDKLVDILKGASKDVVDLLESLNSAIDATVLGEVGKSASNQSSVATDSNTAWNKIEVEAEKIVKSAGVTKQKAIAQVIKEQPSLYRDYLNGGAE